jgi:hypothetical protein
MNEHDIHKMSTKLRAQTCALLKLDPDKLSAGDEILVARVGSLKLLVSDTEAAQLRGEEINLNTYVTASRELEQILRRPAEAAPTKGNDHARARLAELISNFTRAEQFESTRLAAENKQLRSEIAALSAQLHAAQLQPSPPRPDNVIPISDGAARANGAQPPPHYLKPDTDIGPLNWLPPGQLDILARGGRQ